MSRTRRRITMGLLLAAPILLIQTALAQTADPVAGPTTTPHRKSQKTQKQVVLPPLPSGPLSQLPMDQIPPTPAKVSYQGGLLTISAQNSTLGEILQDVHKLTGASIEFPPSGANERVVTHLGPGAPRDVLVGLLNGSSFNYVMLGSSSDPTAVSSVILTPKPSSSGETQSAANVYQNNPGAMPPNRVPQPQPFNQQNIVAQPGQPMVTQQANTESDDAKDDEDNSEDNADDQVQGQPGQPGQPGVSGVNGAEVQDQPQVQQDPNQPNAGPKTPEQILEMLRRQQQPGGAVINPPQPPQQ